MELQGSRGAKQFLKALKYLKCRVRKVVTSTDLEKYMLTMTSQDPLQENMSSEEN